MVTQASQMPPTTEFATKADLESVVQTLSDEFRSEIEASERRIRDDFTAALEASERRFMSALEASEQRLRDDFTSALEASEQRLRSDFAHALNDNKTEILLEIEKAKVTTLRWTYGGTIAIALGMIAAVVALAS